MRNSCDDTLATRRDSNHIGTAATVVILALSLAGCQTPAVRDRIVEVVKPVAVQPIKPADVPVLPSPLPKRPANVSQALDLALAQVCSFVAYAVKADPLLRVSAGLPPMEPPKYPECER
jgi:hypothetical protein